MFELPDGYDEVVPQGARFGKPSINLLFDFWESTMGYPITVKKTDNRRFADLLIKREGLQRVQEYVALASMSRSDKYAPRITSLVDLYYKWDKITDWAMRKRSQQSDVINLD
jgi:hypothetical protein